MSENKKITIGIWVNAEMSGLQRTLDGIRMHTPEPFDLILLPDGPDTATADALTQLKEHPQLATDQALGASACFNRLISYDQADVVVFLESGSIVTPGWLERLLEALYAGPSHGLAGPSTNRAWNEQRLSDALSAEAPAQVVETYAARVAKRYQGVYRTLEPLYSLADFCYVVKREVIEAIGAADEEYGTGPCWEMDYNIRAARAGFKGVWACGAYLHREPLASRRAREEARLLEANKRRYQDKFCRLKIENRRREYCSHCEGDECEYFAPKELIQIRLPLTEDGKQTPDTTPPTTGSEQPQYSHQVLKNKARNLKPETGSSKTATESVPLVSCIMPTYNRRLFVAQAIEYFLRQDYPNRELIIVDDGTDPINDLIPDDPYIRYLHLDEKHTIGTKRNLACNEAKGDIIVHWDDDDWMAPWRLNYQVEGLLSEQADICGLDSILFYDAKHDQAWEYIYPGGGKAWVYGGTLCYTKALWYRNPFPDINVGEDNRFVWSSHSKKVIALQDNRFYVGLIHPGNTSPKRTTGNRWHPYPSERIRNLIGEDLIFSQPNQAGGNDKPQPFSSGLSTHERSISMMTIAREADLTLPEFAAFNHGQSLPRMRRWELPFALFQSCLSNTMSVLDCTINPVNFQEMLIRLYPHTLYRYWNPIQNGQFALPFGVPDEAFDRVICVNTLEHLLKPQRDALIASMARKLKPCGLLILTSDYYFDWLWEQPGLIEAGVMRADRKEIFNGWNKVTPQEWLDFCQRHDLHPMAEMIEEPRDDDPTLYRKEEPYSHACIGGVFYKPPCADLPNGRKIVLALLTWNTCNVSIDSVHAHIREARMLQRLGQVPFLCVCDNGSTDGTVEALQALEPEIDVSYKFILNKENLGSSIARNQIIDYMLECDADYLLFMDGDIEIVPFSSFAMLRYMENSGHRLGCIGADSVGQTPYRERASAYLYSINGCPLETTNLVAWTQYGMFRREVFEDGVRFDETEPFNQAGWGFEDNDLAFQMEMKGYLNQRFFGMTYLHRAARSSIRIMCERGINAQALYARRKQYVIDKWSSVPIINNGPLHDVRRVNMRF